MSMPSDVTSDVTEAMEREKGAPRTLDAQAGQGVTVHFSPEQVGLAATAFIVFLGVSVFGPRLAALRGLGRPNLKAKARRAVEDARRQAEMTGLKARKRVRRLGGGTIRL